MQGRQPQADDFLGLIKFFRNEDFLDKLIAGCMHCQTPETYRLSKLEGVSDRAESCVESWRQARGDEFEVAINGLKIPAQDVVALTIHNGEAHESWLHCWFSLRMPGDKQALDSLVRDLRRMKENFGQHYAFILNKDVRPFLALLQDVSTKPTWAQEVEYTSDVTCWGGSCKSAVYSYQHEYRFGFGACSTNETEPYVFHHPDGFGHLIHKSPEFVMTDSRDGSVWLDLGAL